MTLFVGCVNHVIVMSATASKEMAHRISGRPVLASWRAVRQALASCLQLCDNIFIARGAQVIDDVLDFTAESATLGKPTLNDVRAGVVTCPVLFAAEEHPQLQPLIARRFSHAGDIDTAQALVQNSNGIARARQLAHEYTDAALQCIDELGDSETAHAQEAREALRCLCRKVVQRQK